MNDDQTAASMARTIKRARTTLVAAVAAGLSLDGPGDLSATHVQVFEHLDREGTRLTTLAQRAQMTHQAMSELVSKLIDSGHLERVPDPTDGRARLIRLTQQGVQELRRGARLLEEIRDEWQRELGDLPVDQILRGLQALVVICEDRLGTAPDLRSRPRR